MNFDYSKLTALDMLEFQLTAMRGDWGTSVGTLALIAKTGVDLTSIPITQTTKAIQDFWNGLAEYKSKTDIEQLFKGE